MSDEEFLLLKNQIKELGFMCHEINSTFSELKEEISGLGKSITDFESDVHKLKTDVSIMEAVKYEW